MPRLDGKVALVTGSSREGADVIINYRRDAAAADATVHAIKELGRNALAVQADVSRSPG